MSVSITTRTTKTGAKRYIVRGRIGGRAWPMRNWGTFTTMKEARIRRDLVGGEIAAGRDPSVLLEQLQAEPLKARTFEAWADEYRASRVDAAEETRRGIKTRTAAMLPHIGDMDPNQITPQTVAELIAALTLKPSSMRKYVATLRSVLDYAGVDPNPARDERVRLPRMEHEELEPPSGADVIAIITHTSKRWRLALRVLAEAGLRAGELAALEFRDVDQANSRVRVRAGKTKAARRWAAVPPELMAEIAATVPPDDRTPNRRVFPGASPATLRVAMRRSCDAAGISLFSPHDFRHRYASVQVARGVPLPMLAAQLGHARTSLTLDTYSHALLNEEDS